MIEPRFELYDRFETYDDGYSFVVSVGIRPRYYISQERAVTQSLEALEKLPAIKTVGTKAQVLPTLNFLNNLVEYGFIHTSGCVISPIPVEYIRALLSVMKHTKDLPLELCQFAYRLVGDVFKLEPTKILADTELIKRIYPWPN